MLERFTKVDNPLTIIAIFAGITEVVSSISLPLLNHDTQQIIVWFIILFPIVLITAFFLTLNFNTKVLYAPADYRDEKHFLEVLNLSQTSVKVSVTSVDDAPPTIEKLQQSACEQSLISPFEGITKIELETINNAFHYFGEKAKTLFESGLISGYSFGVHGEGLFLLNVFLKDFHRPDAEARIIRVRTSSNGIVELGIIGEKLTSSNPDQFADIVIESLQRTIQHKKEQEERNRDMGIQ